MTLREIGFSGDRTIEDAIGTQSQSFCASKRRGRCLNYMIFDPYLGNFEYREYRLLDMSIKKIRVDMSIKKICQNIFSIN